MHVDERERAELAEAKRHAALEDGETRERLRARGFPKRLPCLGPGCSRVVLSRSPGHRLCGRCSWVTHIRARSHRGSADDAEP